MSRQGAAGAPLDQRFERSVRRWLWAYPRRWRMARADEVVGTLAEMAPPGATRLGWRDGLGLVLNGWATTRRMRPPLRVRLAFRLSIGTVPWRYRGWVADEIARPWSGVEALLVFGAVMAVSRVAFGLGDVFSMTWWIVYTGLLLATPHERRQRQAASRYLVPRTGDTPTPWDQKPGWVYRDRLVARPTLRPLAWAAATVAAASAAVTVLTDSGSVAALTVCLGLGVLAAARLGIRWSRRVTVLPHQPARRMVVPGRRRLVVVWCWALLLVLTVLPATDPTATPTPDAPPTYLAPPVLGLMLLVLPSLALAARLATHARVDLAAVDVWRLVGDAGPLRVDELERGVVPMWFGPEVAVGLGEIPPAPTDPTPA